MFEDYTVSSGLVPSDPRFGVGPSLIPVQFLESLAKTGTELLGTSHRKPAVKALVKEMQDGLRQYFSIPQDYEVVIGNGGATFLFDMIGLGLVKKSSLHFTCGEFSQKWFKSHNKIPWIEATEVAAEYGQGIDPEYREGFDTICCTLNETSTGVIINDVPDCRDKDDVIVCVDATSGAGQVPIDLEKVDVFFFSPQKVFAAEGGFYVSIMSPKAIKRAREIADSDRYYPEIMNWNHAIDNSVKNQTYNTPSVANIFFLNEQVKRMNMSGYEKVKDHAKDKAEMIYGWANDREYLSAFVQEEKYRSMAVATIDLDEKYSADDLCKVLRQQKVVYDIEAYRKLGRNQFRISLFHNVRLGDLEKLTQIIDEAIAQHKANNP
jgi:phosphoserine aminotransferase